MALGHRQRIREKIAECGIKALHDHELLEYVLYPFIPRKDVSTLARTLLNDFGDLHSVITATPADLRRYKDMTDSAAQFLPLIPEFYARAVAKNLSVYGRCMNPYVSSRYFYSKLAHLDHERLVVIAVDSTSRYIKERCVDGTTAYATFNLGDLAEFAITAKASKIIVGHNHPLSTEAPSLDDIMTNNKIYECLKTIGVTFSDHVIIAQNKYFSFAERDIPLHTADPSTALYEMMIDYVPSRVKGTEDINNN